MQDDKYKAVVVWNEIRPKKDKQDWHKLVWSSLSIPKHTVISWMATLDRLPTLDRMASWEWK